MIYTDEVTMSSNHKNDSNSVNKHYFTNVIPVATDSIVNKVKIQRTPGHSNIDNKSTKSPETIKKSRGRPRIIKNYNDPMMSPMAATSSSMARCNAILNQGGTLP